MNRRAKGEGNVRLRADGRWEGRLMVDGRSRSYFAPTQREALRKLREAQRRVDGNLPLPPENLTVEKFMETWLATKKTTMRPDSWARYEVRARLHLNPEIGKVKLTRLQPEHLRAAYAAIGKKVSPTTVQHVHGMIRVALRDAEREGLVARNVAGLVTPPRRSTPEMRALQPQEARELLAAVEGDELEAFYVVALTAGLRLGELQALMWADLDRERRRISVRRTLAVDGQPVFSPTSSRKNHLRTVWLTQAAMSALDRREQAQRQQRELAGDAWREHGLVFTNAVGNPLDGRNVRRRSFPQVLQRAGLPPFRIHDLRHSAATLLLADGVPVKVVSEMLGHADVSTTLRIYAHVLEGAQAQAVSTMDRLFHG